MIRLNFIPENLRKDKGGLLQGGFGAVSAEIIVGIFVAAVLFLLFVHLAFMAVAVGKIAQYKVLEGRWNSMAASKKSYDDVFNRTKELQAQMNTVKPITSQRGAAWARLMNEISDSVPKGVWLRDVSFTGGQLSITGSSVSKVKGEMMAAGNFVAALKERSSFRDYFTGIDVDSIQRRDVAGLSIADFTLKAKAK